MTDIEILDLPMQDNDSGAGTIRGYLKCLMTALITEQEGFSGKRPFGNSWWMVDLELALVKGGVIAGVIDEEGWLEECNSRAATAILLRVIDSL